MPNTAGRPLRKDTKRNQRRLMEAVSELAREEPGKLTMQAIADRAEIGTATAYRYYPTLDAVLSAYVLSTVEQLRRFCEESPLEGRELFDALLTKWLELLDEHGPVMVHLRSRRGFLERLHAGNDVIQSVASSLTRPLLGLLDDLELPRDQIENALFLWNIIFDPREIHDLRIETGLPREAIASRLTAAYIGALRGWAAAAT